MNARANTRLIAAAASILDQLRAQEAEARTAEAARPAAPLRGRFPVPPRRIETWTPKAVGEALTEAVRWAQHAAGRVGPGGFASSRLPEALLSLEDHAAAGWGLPETTDDPNDLPPMRVLPSPAKVAAMEAALDWPRRYLHPDHVGSATMLSLWIGCKVRKLPFGQTVAARGTIARATAYRLRDRGLSIIAQGLDRDGVPLSAGSR